LDKKLEKRQAFFKTEFTTRETQEEKIIEGFFIVYNRETELWEGFYEQIKQGAAANSVKNNDIRALFNHYSGSVLGRTSSNTLKLEDREQGVYGIIIINQNDTEALNIYERVKRGDITGCSFGFWPENETYEDRVGGGTLATINEANVVEVSVCTFPAYPQTQIDARQRDFKTLQKEKLSRKKEELKARLKKNG